MLGNKHTVKITGLSHEGRGITHINSKITFVDNALPGETVEIEILKKHSRYNQARLISLLEASPDRVTPRCIHAEICGGCQLQHLETTAQLALKQNTLLEQLKHSGHTTPLKILPPLHSPPWGYRSKGRLSVKYVEKKQKLLIGFHEKNGRYIADLTQCDVLEPRIGKAFSSLKQLISSLSISTFIPQIEIACDAQHCALIFRCLKDLSAADIALLQLFGKENNFHLYSEPNKPQLITQLWPLNHHGLLSYHFENITFNFHPKDFTQINPAINQQMIGLALELLSLEKTDIVLDLFCGLGNFTLPIAKHCAQVTGIEGDEAMVRRARDNAAQNHLFNTTFYSANLFEPDKNAPWIQKKYDKILLDPPRTGAIEILPYLKQWQARTIVYISCNPATLARDTAEFIKHGYQLNAAGVLDMFPHTRHVESVALFML